jgi:uncharacterized protein (DUF433 family)
MVRRFPIALDVIRVDAHDDLRVGSTNVLLDTVVREFQNGATCEEIVLRFSTLSLADAYGAIAFYLQNREYVDAYMAEREREGAETQRRIEALQRPISEVRERIFARHAAQMAEGSHAARG